MATALVIVDVQSELVDLLDQARRDAFLDTLRTLLERARSTGTAIVYIRHDGGPSELTAGTPGWEIAREIAPSPSEPIVDKRFRDAFRETNLADVLARANIDHVVVGGMQTDYCVDATVREAERRGYRVTLVADGHATYAAGSLSEDRIREHMHRVTSGIAEIVPAAELFVGAAERA